MKHLSSATIAMAFAAAIIAGPALAGEAPSCKELITPEMVAAACGAKMKMGTRGKDEPKRCDAKLNNVDMMDGSLIYFTVNTYPDETKAAKEHERWKKASRNNAAPEKVAANKADGMPYIESLTDIPGIGSAAYEQELFNPATDRNRIMLNVLTGHHRIEINSDMWMGNSLPCDSGQLRNLAREVVEKLGH